MSYFTILVLPSISATHFYWVFRSNNLYKKEDIHANFILSSPDSSISWQLVLLVGTKLQHIIATLALESAGITGYNQVAKLKPRDELFWFKKPELLLSLIHFVLFQVTTNLLIICSFQWRCNFCILIAFVLKCIVSFIAECIWTSFILLVLGKSFTPVSFSSEIKTMDWSYFAELSIYLVYMFGHTHIQYVVGNLAIILNEAIPYCSGSLAIILALYWTTH